jgi:small-conductance mechanosensitive channel
MELHRAERLVSSREHELKFKKTKKSTMETDDSSSDDEKGKAKDRDVEGRTKVQRIGTWFRKFPRSVRYLLYGLFGESILLAAVLVGYLGVKPGTGAVGGVYLMWFGIWLEIVWGSLWTLRMICCIFPAAFKMGASLAGSNNPKKWKDIGRQLELPVAQFLWLLTILISTPLVLNGHKVDVDADEPEWVRIIYKIIISFFVLACLNLVEKGLIQWIATSFHQRTYSNRIANQKKGVDILATLYGYARNEGTATSERASTSSAPTQTFHENTRNRLGKIVNRIGNDIIGRKGEDTSHPRRVVNVFLKSKPQAHSLARIIFRALREDDKETVLEDDMKKAFVGKDEDAGEAFGHFDRDLNGDISMQEFEGVCNEMHLEKKSIAASLKDLDSVIKKLDRVFLVIIVAITIIVFISIISNSAATALGSAGASILGLAWMLQATAQEFLQSIIFVFVKHPFDVGDRVTIYGNAGAEGRGDDYYVTEISLLYTEFRKMEGHIVQAPNSTLNNLFILNQRRSNRLADPVQLKIRFGTTEEQIEQLKERMQAFINENKRDYHGKILTEIRTIDELRSATMNFIFFHKSNYQNELLRLTRHNKFVTELMRQMIEVGIQGPYRNEPGGSKDFPFFWTGCTPAPSYANEVLQSPSDDANHPFPPITPMPSTGNTGGVNGLAPPRSASTATARTARRPRGPSAAAVASELEDEISDFQDVYSSRRDESARFSRPSNETRQRRATEVREGLARMATVHRHATATGVDHEGGLGRSTTVLGTAHERARALFGRPQHESSARPGDAGAGHMV